MYFHVLAVVLVLVSSSCVEYNALIDCDISATSTVQ